MSHVIAPRNIYIGTFLTTNKKILPIYILNGKIYVYELYGPHKNTNTYEQFIQTISF